jgi:short-subunit dehydrogenase
VETKFGSWALVAGGSEGIGASLAQRLAAEGVNLALVARRAEPLALTADGLRRRHGIEVRTLALDLTDPAAVDRIDGLCDGCEIGTLVYNAGAAHAVGPLLDQPVERALQLVRLNCLTLTELVYRHAQRMRARRLGGNILLLGSGAGISGAAGIAVYAAAKAFVHSLAEGLWYEFRPHGIRVLCLVLGLTKTPAMERAGLRANAEFPAGDPDVVADAALAQLDAGPIQLMPAIRPFVESLGRLSTIERVTAISEATLRLKA